MADWLIEKASEFKSGQDLLDEMGRQGFDLASSEAAPMEDPMADMLGEPPMEEPPMDEDKGKGKKKVSLSIMRIGAAEKAIDKDKKAKKKAKDEEEGY
tara:strand:+ start:465 stop:758 length:294 start_codon:yes stop_codon:yes gene_type:complete